MSDTIISFNEDVIHTELKDLVRTSVAEALWGAKVSPGTSSNLNKSL